MGAHRLIAATTTTTIAHNDVQRMYRLMCAILTIDRTQLKEAQG